MQLFTQDNKQQFTGGYVLNQSDVDISKKD